MITLFLLLRVTTGLMIIGALLVLAGSIFLRSGAAFLKEGVRALGYIATLFTSGFTKETQPEKPAGWMVSLPQVFLAALFIAMMVSLFQPEEKIFLHILAVMVGMAVIWYVRMLLTEVKLEIFCLLLLAVWFVYYATCIFWRGQRSLQF